MRVDIARHISLWSGVVMILLVTCGAVAILFTDAFSDRLYGTKRTLFVIMLLAYAAYRVFRIRQLLRPQGEKPAQQ